MDEENNKRDKNNIKWRRPLIRMQSRRAKSCILCSYKKEKRRLTTKVLPSLPERWIDTGILKVMTRKTKSTTRTKSSMNKKNQSGFLSSRIATSMFGELEELEEMEATEMMSTTIIKNSSKMQTRNIGRPKTMPTISQLIPQEFLEPEDTFFMDRYFNNNTCWETTDCGDFESTEVVPFHMEFARNDWLDLCFAIDSEEEEEEEESSKQEEEDEMATTEVMILIVVDGEWKMFRALLDSGTTKTLATKQAIERAKLKIRASQTRRGYQTVLGEFRTVGSPTIRKHQIMDLSGRRHLLKMPVEVHDGTLGRYDFILGRDYMQRYGINLLFKSKEIEWDGKIMPMRPRGYWTAQRMEDLFFCVDDPLEGHLFEESYAAAMLDSKYEKQDLEQVCRELKHLSLSQQQQLLSVLQRHSTLLEGRLGTWKDVLVDVDLLPNVQPYHCKNYIPIPHIYLETLKKEIERLIAIGVLERADGPSDWCAPGFVIPKKDNRPRLIIDLRQANKAIKRTPWPMPYITNLISEIGRYKYCTCLDLSMGYYHFQLSERLKEMTTFVLPFGRFRYRRLPMGLNISPDFFQKQMTQLFGDLPNVKCYLDDIAIHSNGTYEEHLADVEEVLRRMARKGLQINALKSFWATDQPVEYLGFLLTPEGIRPQPKKVKAMMNLAIPKTRKQLRQVIGLINYYRYMWKRRSHLLAPLTALLSTKKKFEWTKGIEKSDIQGSLIIFPGLLKTVRVAHRRI
mmetsp:Transcript_119887/g.346392  ORF Transcript_119887/g.346392 Transcript_119887/m.346392 type:complete len:738 (-) Transcript_119887:6878-9091(-)